MKFLRTLLYGLALIALPVHASVVLGHVGIETDVPGTGEEDVVVYNVTGPIFGCSTAATFPICTAVTFDNAVLTVNGTQLDLGDIGPGITETYTVPDGVFLDGFITSLSFSATLSTTALTDGLGNHYNVSSTFSLTDIPTDGSLPAIAAPLALTSIPEPSSLVLLLGMCFAGTAAALCGHRKLS